MNTILKTAIFVTALLMLGGCATKALTPEEQAFQDAQRSCTCLLYTSDAADE